MPLYVYRCEKCKGIKESVRSIDSENPLCCGEPMRKLPAPPALVRIDGQGYPSRKKWMDNWTPDSPPFSTGSLHGERY